MLFALAACQPAATSSPVTGTVNTEITLAPDQSAAVTNTNLTITFDSVEGDDRCPREVECVASGPVTVSLSVQEGSDDPTDFTLQTFTDQNGRAPNVQFEGVTNQVEAGSYQIRITGVTPYPVDSTTRIQPSEYRLSLLVTNQ